MLVEAKYEFRDLALLQKNAAACSEAIQQGYPWPEGKGSTVESRTYASSIREGKTESF